ncbi:HD domain-containing protein [Massilia kyonggiensis]|nr:HD domain-containing protein [Massilia kyonggiensis]
MNALPDSRLAREITQYVRGMANDSASDMLFQHSARVYWWGALLGEKLGLAFDRELLYAAAMFHDIGITPHYHGSRQRFEVDGANAARDFLRGHGIDEHGIERVWLAIALHTTPGIPEHMHPEIRLVQAGAGMDMVGRGLDAIPPAERDRVLAAHPRGHGFAHDVIDTFYEGLKHRPETTFGTFNDDFLAFRDPAFQRGNLCSLLLAAHP